MKVLGFDEEGMEWFKKRFIKATISVIVIWITLSLLFWFLSLRR